MKTEKELDTAILKITMKIREQYPELSKYISEMPDTIPNMENPKMNTKTLQGYYDSLDVLLKDYIKNQHSPTK
ncbi:hypothetical protein SAMN05443549_104316 [Flavobacterium fluvii]|uniref:Uncharacterized protein n=1 Tax=Flavobacterium fluvii TaxID=468056 RepID=A0A1M5KI44_9FLAO|nr:hypothetical protein [Flavobacterium fluvii]SHG52159.1 hypothetical protein SAMN05443549_104316 [Flavobacterium fluvii]